MKEHNLLPIGTVVLLKEETQELMIIGYAPIDKETEEDIYDYSACLYPVGLLAVDQVIMFDHEDIEKIIFTGYEDKENTEFLKNVEELLQNKEGLLQEARSQAGNQE